jgi:predicted restriction endonuclease
MQQPGRDIFDVRKKIKNATIDATFSKLIREQYDYVCAKPDCPECHNVDLRNVGGLECSHYHPRQFLAGRWHPDNCLCLCREMHMVIDRTWPKNDHADLMAEILGETRWEALKIRLRGTFKYPQWERIEMHKHYRAQYENLKHRRDRDGTRGFIDVVAWD